MLKTQNISADLAQSFMLDIWQMINTSSLTICTDLLFSLSRVLWFRDSFQRDFISKILWLFWAVVEKGIYNEHCQEFFNFFGNYLYWYCSLFNEENKALVKEIIELVFSQGMNDEFPVYEYPVIKMLIMIMTLSLQTEEPLEILKNCYPNKKFFFLSFA